MKKEKRLSRIIVKAASILVLIFMFTACGKNSEDSGEKQSASSGKEIPVEKKDLSLEQDTKETEEMEETVSGEDTKIDSGKDDKEIEQDVQSDIEKLDVIIEQDEKTDVEEDKTFSETKEPEISIEQLANNALKEKLEEIYEAFKEEKINAWKEFCLKISKLDPNDCEEIMGLDYSVTHNGISWNKYNKNRQLYYTYLDIDNDNVKELIIYITFFSSESGYGNMYIFKYSEMGVISVLESGCDAHYSEKFPICFNKDFMYVEICDDGKKLYKLNRDRYELLACYFDEQDYGECYENNIKQSDITLSQYEKLRKKAIVSEVWTDMEVYNYPENPFTIDEQRKLYSPLSEQLVNKAIAEGHISKASKNYTVDDIDNDGIVEVIINDYNSIMVYDYYGNAGVKIISQDLLLYNSIKIGYFYEDKMIYCSSYFDYNGSDGFRENSNEYYFYVDGNEELCILEKDYQVEDSDFDEQFYFNGNKISEEQFEEKIAKGSFIELEPYHESEPNHESEYLIPDSDKRYLTAEELSVFSNNELRIARNELFARHGYIFTSDIKEYFEGKSWYKGEIEDYDYIIDNLMNTYEKKNLETISQLEEDRKL